MAEIRNSNVLYGQFNPDTPPQRDGLRPKEKMTEEKANAMVLASIDRKMNSWLDVRDGLKTPEARSAFAELLNVSKSLDKEKYKPALGKTPEQELAGIIATFSPQFEAVYVSDKKAFKDIQVYFAQKVKDNDRLGPYRDLVESIFK